MLLYFNLRCLALGSAVCAIATMLVACGGGGGGGTAGDAGGLGSSPPPSGSLLVADPAVAALSIAEGERGIFRFKVLASRTVAETVNVRITDSGGVVEGIPSIQGSGLSYDASIRTSQNLVSGQYTGFFTVQLCMDSPTTCAKPYADSLLTIPYTVDVRPWKTARTTHKLLVAETGIALASMPDRARLTRTIDISDNLNAVTAWTASSDVPWLTVTGAGKTGASGSTLTLNANPSGLPANTISYATITVRSVDGTAAPDSVVVGLWKASTPSAATISSVATAYETAVVTPDPVRPYVYAVSGGDTIEVANVHTGQRVASYALPGSRFELAVASPDGSTLYVIDGIGNAAQMRVFDIRQGLKLQDTRQLARLPASAIVYPQITSMVYARLNGVGVLISNSGFAYRASDGKLLASDIGVAPFQFADGGTRGSYLTLSNDSSKLFYYLNGRNSVQLDYSDAGEGVLSVRFPFIGAERGGPGILLLSRDDSKGFSARCDVINPNDLSYSGRIPLNGSSSCDRMTSDGRIVGVTSTDYRVFSTEGRVDQVITSSLRFIPGIKAVSADGLSLVTTGDTGPQEGFRRALLFMRINPRP